MTFLFTDIQGSTRRWEADAAAMRAALMAHDEVLRSSIEAHDGFLFSHTGDGPLAIELAASRMASMTAIEVRDRLDQRFRLLVGPRRGLAHHHTLRHAVAGPTTSSTTPKRHC